MRLRVASWNVNSVRLRADQVARFIREQGVDVLCLQEIKCQESEFPVEALAQAGLPHLRVRGQKGWHGVAIASRLPIDDAPLLSVCREGHARCVGAMIAGIEIQNFYIPAGGDIPDPAVNPKFAHKLDFFARLSGLMAQRDPRAPLIIAGHSDGATAAAFAAYASTCSSVPIRAVVALSPDDVPMTGAFRFGRPPALLAVTGTADEVNPLAHTLGLYQHVPGQAWLVTIDGGSHLGTFTTDPDLARISATIADFVFMTSDGDASARTRLMHVADGRVHLQYR